MLPTVHIHADAGTVEGPKQTPRALDIIAASGMATAGRILHHFKRRLPDKNTTVLLTGFQAIGPRGRSLQEGASSIRIHGQDVPRSCPHSHDRRPFWPR